MIHVGNTILINSPIEDVWKLFNDVQSLGKCVPTCKKVEVIDKDKIDVLMQIVLGIVPLQNKLTLTIEERDEPRYLFARGISYCGDAFKGIKKAEDQKDVQVELRITLNLEPLGPQETRAEYSIEVEAFGAIQRIYEGIIRGKRSMIEQGFMKNVGSFLGAEVRELAPVLVEA